MEYTINEKVIITSWSISFDCLEECRRKFATKFNKAPPPRTSILRWKEKLLATGSLDDRPRSGRPVTASGDDNKKLVLAACRNDPTTSSRRLSDELQLSQSSVCRILHKSKMHPYKPIYSQFLSDGDDDRRLEFCELMTEKFNADPAYLRKITFSDECVFALDGKVNKHNVHFWANENPNVRICNPGKTQTLTVWACISFSGVIAYDISLQSMNSQRYCEILSNKVVPFFTRRKQMLYQQDGASPHYSLNARRILNEEMPDQWIGRRGPIEWPARSPDLTACDYWLWSQLRQKVYTPGTIFQSLDALRTKIIDELTAIPLDMFRKAMRDFPKRVEKCIENEGGLFEE